jgi:hypothetical protein
MVIKYKFIIIISPRRRVDTSANAWGKFRASESTDLPQAPTNPHWARMMGYGPFSLWVIHKERLCPRSEDIIRLMMMIISTNAIGIRVV